MEVFSAHLARLSALHAQTTGLHRGSLAEPQAYEETIVIEDTVLISHLASCRY